MALSHVQTETPMALVRAAAWCNSLSRMGLNLPLFVVHDIGVMLSMTRGVGGYSLRPREAQLQRIGVPPQSKPHLDEYRKLLEDIAGSEVTERLAGPAAARRDDRRAAAAHPRRHVQPLARAHEERGRRGAAARSRRARRGRLRGALPRLRAEAAVGLRRAPRRAAPARVHAGRAHRSRHRAPARPVQGRLGVGQRGARRRDRPGRSVRQRRSGLPEANDIANFSLDLLPSVLETRRSTGAQDVRGRRLHASVERKGNVDSLVLQRARVRPRDLRAEGRRQRAALLRPLQAARGRAPAAISPHRLQRVDARAAPGVRARPRARADQEAHARGRRDLGALLRLAHARDDQDRPQRPGAGAVPAVVPQRARPQLRQGVSATKASSSKDDAPAPRAEAARRDVRDQRTRAMPSTSSPSS